MTNPQLRLVTDAPPGFDTSTADAARRIFEHWLFMLGRSPRRCKLGPARNQAIRAALAMGYEVDTLLLAIEGMASDPLHDVSKPMMRDAMREIDWLFGAERRIERWAGLGEQLRAELAAPPPASTSRAPDGPPADPVAEAAARDRLRQLAASLRGAAHG